MSRRPARRALVAVVLGGAVMVSGCGQGWQDEVAAPPVTDLFRTQQISASSEDSTGHRLAVLLTAAHGERGEPYNWGADGPEVWDCSSFVRHAYAEVGIRMPRTARDQRAWMADGNGVRVTPGEEQPGDLVFWDDYRGPEEIGHVAMVWDPDSASTIEARPPQTGFYGYDGARDNNRFEIWRAKDFSGPLEST